VFRHPPIASLEDADHKWGVRIRASMTRAGTSGPDTNGVAFNDVAWAALAASGWASGGADRFLEIHGPRCVHMRRTAASSVRLVANEISTAPTRLLAAYSNGVDSCDTYEYESKVHDAIVAKCASLHIGLGRSSIRTCVQCLPQRNIRIAWTAKITGMDAVRLAGPPPAAEPGVRAVGLVTAAQIAELRGIRCVPSAPPWKLLWSADVSWSTGFPMRFAAGHFADLDGIVGSHSALLVVFTYSRDGLRIEPPGGSRNAGEPALACACWHVFEATGIELCEVSCDTTRPVYNTGAMKVRISDASAMDVLTKGFRAVLDGAEAAAVPSVEPGRAAGGAGGAGAKVE
jgi:hypothetical protein